MTMKRPTIPRSARRAVLADIAEARADNCRFLRSAAHGRWCGKCIACDAAGIIERQGARLH
jgi:hypothetical protein